MPEPYKIVYDYDSVPTIRKFAQSNKRIKGILGPFASGKSSGCIMEIIRRAHEQKQSQDGIRRSRWAVIRNCYDDQTEILTEKRGWQLFKNLTLADKVASLVNDNELIFVTPSSYYADWYNGEMAGFSNQSIDFLVTPDHHLYASKMNSKRKGFFRYKLHKASDVYGMTHYRFKVNVDEYNGGETEYSEKMFEFFGFWFAEGCAGKYPNKKCHGFNWQLVVSQSGSGEYVEGLLSDCGFRYGKYHLKTCINYGIYKTPEVKILIEKLIPCGKAINKSMPQWIKNAPRGHLKAFLRGYANGDGYKRKGSYDSTKLYTSSEKLANDLQEIIFKAGGSASLSKNLSSKENGEWGTTFPGQKYRFIVVLRQPSYFLPSTKPNKTKVKCGWYKKQYDGMVYCVEVPSHVVLVRRCNKIIWLGQTYSQLKDTTIRTVFDWLPETVFGEYSVTNHVYCITKFPGVHIELMFRALDRPEQISNLLSLELTGAWVNEAREVPWEIIDALDGRINRYPGKKDGGCTWCGIIMDTNPPDENSEWYKYFEVKRPSTAAIFKQPSGLSSQAENLKNLAKDYYKTLAIGKNDQYVRVYIEGKYGYTQEGKAVIEQYNDNVHVALSIIQPMEDIPLICGMDFGLNPTLLLAQITPRGKLLILDEFVSDGMGLRQFCNNILQPQLRMNYFGMPILGGYGDPAGTSRSPTDESTCYEVLRDIGLKQILPCPTNALLPRIAAVEGLLTKMIDGEPALVISPKCVMLRKALNGGYHRQRIPGTTNEFSDQPFKNIYSHPADALQYMCYYVNDSKSKNKRNEEFLKRIGKQTKHRPASSIAGM